MGFDLIISLDLSINEHTGLPFVYGPNCERLPYVPSDFEVPHKYRKWVQRRGSVFHLYIKGHEGYMTSAENFLDRFPGWADVCNEMGPNGAQEYDWTEDDHYDFKKAIEWFAKKNHFTVSWSY
jgi:hypothetical protein